MIFTEVCLRDKAQKSVFIVQLLEKGKNSLPSVVAKGWPPLPSKSQDQSNWSFRREQQEEESRNKGRKKLPKLIHVNV